MVFVPENNEDNDNIIVQFCETQLINVRPGDASLPIDTSAEWTKGFQLINQLIYELYQEKYVEDFEDDNGNSRQRTRFHPQLLPLIQERRRTIDQIYKISGKEATNEVKKEFGKLAAKAIFEGTKDRDLKEKHKQTAIEIIEAEFNEGRK